MSVYVRFEIERYLLTLLEEREFANLRPGDDSILPVYRLDFVLIIRQAV